MIPLIQVYTDSAGLQLAWAPGLAGRHLLGQRCCCLSSRRPPLQRTEVRVSDPLRHRNQMELEATIVFKRPMNAWVLMGTKSKAAGTSHWCTSGDIIEASWTWLLCRYVEGNFPKGLGGWRCLSLRGSSFQLPVSMLTRQISLPSALSYNSHVTRLKSYWKLLSYQKKWPWGPLPHPAQLEHSQPQLTK